ncbi:MAG: hypothetical protein AAFP02_16910 [Bacteroidota bacterium]
MKTFKISLFLIAVLASLSSCTQNVEVDIVDPTFAEVTTSQSFQAYQSFFSERRRLIDEHVVFDTEAFYPSKEAQLAAVNETIRMAQEKAALMNKIAEHLASQNEAAAKTKDEMAASLIEFIQQQEADPKAKANFIELTQFEVSQDVEALRENVLQEFPSLEVEELHGVLKQYQGAQANL